MSKHIQSLLGTSDDIKNAIAVIESGGNEGMDPRVCETSLIQTITNGLTPKDHILFNVCLSGIALTWSVTLLEGWLYRPYGLSFHYITFMAGQMLPFTVNDGVSYDLFRLWKQ